MAVTYRYRWLDSDHGHHQLSVNLTADDWRKSPAITDELEVVDGGGFQQCSSQWKPPQHAVFHAAHAVLLVSFVIPNTRRTLVFIHLALVAGTNSTVTYLRNLLDTL